MPDKTEAPSTARVGIGFFGFLKLVGKVRSLRARERWPAERIKAYQAEELQKLRRFAYARSPFYKAFHRGLEDRPLSELPVLTKQELMRSWDDVVTDRSLKLKDVEGFLETMMTFGAYKGTHYAFATGGTTGVKGVFVYDKDEFLTMFALTARASGWMGARLSWRERPRAAVVQSHLPWHVAGAAQSLKVPFLKTLVLDSLEPMERLVAQLNDFQPHLFGGYAGNVHLLAEEQIAGRLKIAPKTVLTTAETLKKEARTAIETAWGIKPFEVYGSTETAETASECGEHKGLHVYDDVVILEVVDRENRPVPPGTYGSKVLATVLWRRSIPLIRYEISDHLRMSATPCPCGRPFPLIQDVQGREEQVIVLPGKEGGAVRIEPDLFFDAMVLLPVDGWQVVQEREDAITFLILRPHPRFDEAEFLRRMTEELAKQGAEAVSLTVEYVQELRRTKVGKVVTIQAFTKDAKGAAETRSTGSGPGR